MNARVLLFICLAMVIGSVALIPASAYMGVRGDTATAISYLSLLGGIAAAFMTVKTEKDAGRSCAGDKGKKP